MENLEAIGDDIVRRNESLLGEIVQLCERSDRQSPEVILLLGTPGSGKSAIINTIHNVITGKYFHIAKQGSGDTQSLTSSLKRYDNCGTCLESISNEEKCLLIKKIFDKLPRILDFAGLPDANTPELAEFLELLVGGFVPENTNIEALMKKQKEYGVGCLKKMIYKNSDPQMKVTKVVFVQSVRSTIPQQLINCLYEVLAISDPETLTVKYTQEVFLLITRYDLVQDVKLPVLSMQHSERQDHDGTLTFNDFQKVEHNLARLFNIVGDLEKNRICWVNYTDRVDKENPYIANIVLHFLKRMLEPGLECNKQKADKPVIGFWQSLQLELFRLRNEQQLQVSAHILLLILLSVVVLYLSVKILNEPENNMK